MLAFQHVMHIPVRNRLHGTHPDAGPHSSLTHFSIQLGSQLCSGARLCSLRLARISLCCLLAMRQQRRLWSCCVLQRVPNGGRVKPMLAGIMGDSCVMHVGLGSETIAHDCSVSSCQHQGMLSPSCYTAMARHHVQCIGSAVVWQQASA